MTSSGIPMDICEHQAQKLLKVEEAQHHFLSQAIPLAETEKIATQHTLGRVLAEDIFANFDVPGIDNSAMDGYAIQLADLDATIDRRLKVSQTIAAGAAPQVFQQGTTARIFTGAPLPSGADAVIPQEACLVEDGWVTFPAEIKTGDNIRRCGEELRKGEKLLRKGHKIRAQELGLLATLGVAEVSVIRPLRVAIFSTGDELTPIGKPLQPGKIYDSNRYILMSLLQTLGHQVIDLGTVEDQHQATCDTLKQAAQQADLIVTSGGVSVGDEDHVKNAVAELGHIDSWRIAIKPGKPLAYGQVANVPFFGLPGNPVATFITFCLFVRPYLLKKQGVEQVEPRSIILPAGFGRKAGKRREYLRANIEQGRIVPLAKQGSAMMSSLTQSEGLVVIPEQREISENMPLEYIPFNALFN